MLLEAMDFYSNACRCHVLYGLQCVYEIGFNVLHSIKDMDIMEKTLNFELLNVFRDNINFYCESNYILRKNTKGFRIKPIILGFIIHNFRFSNYNDG